MDHDRFDRLAQRFGAGTTRRAALGLLAALGLGAAPAPNDAAAAKKKCGACKRRVGGKCKPKPDGSRCSGGTCQNGKCGSGRGGRCAGGDASCGGECCANCFAAQVNPDNNLIALDYACCPANKVCRKPGTTWPDQCCYPDESCDPGWPDREPFLADSLCCRTCGDPDFQGCCPATHNCVNGNCVEAGTPRLPRLRRR